MRLRPISRVFLIVGSTALLAATAANAVIRQFGFGMPDDLSYALAIVGSAVVVVGSILRSRINRAERVDVAQRRLIAGANDVISAIATRPGHDQGRHPRL